jgi:Ser/Thr protein kinase RdoA (MazF antagonist)
MLVGLQAQWSGRVDVLLATGLPDWRADALTQAVESVARRTDPDLSAPDRRALRHLVSGLPQRMAAVAECGIADSLVHGDFAPGNARGHGDHLVLLDWGDCGVGHPLLDRSAFLDRVPGRVVEPVREHWNRAWRQAAPGSDPERAGELLAPVSAARQAVIYQGFLDRIEASEHPYHRSDPALWLTRAAELFRQVG